MRTKKMVASVLAIALVMCTPAMVAEARSIETGELAGAYVSGESQISSTGASCTTSVGANAVAQVSGTYYYLNIKTMTDGSKSSANGGLHVATVSFTAPTDCRSVSVFGNHSVTYSGQNWSTSTDAVY